MQILVDELRSIKDKFLKESCAKVSLDRRYFQLIKLLIESAEKGSTFMDFYKGNKGAEEHELYKFIFSFHVQIEMLTGLKIEFDNDYGDEGDSSWSHYLGKKI